MCFIWYYSLPCIKVWLCVFMLWKLWPTFLSQCFIVWGLLSASACVLKLKGSVMRPKTSLLISQVRDEHVIKDQGMTEAGHSIICALSLCFGREAEMPSYLVVDFFEELMVWNKSSRFLCATEICKITTCKQETLLMAESTGMYNLPLAWRLVTGREQDCQKHKLASVKETGKDYPKKARAISCLQEENHMGPFSITGFPWVISLGVFKSSRYTKRKKKDACKSILAICCHWTKSLWDMDLSKSQR